MTPESRAVLLAGMATELARTEPPAGFPPLPVVPSGRYTEPAFQALEHERLWRQSWLFACHRDEVANPGDFVLFRRTGSPILVVHGPDGRLRAFYNTCRHRGAPLVQAAAGHVAGLTCPYHGWTYALDGRLVGWRDRRDFPDFDPACHALVEVACDTWGAFVFVNEDAAAPPLATTLGGIPALWAEVEPERTRLVHRQSYPVACNVKVLLDAFLEVYHLKSIHQHTVDRFLDHRGTTIHLWPHGHSLMVTPNRRPDWQDPGARGMPRIPGVSEIAAGHNPSYLVFPNLVAPLADTGWPLLLFWPTGPRSMEIEVVWLAPDRDDAVHHPGWPVRIANFERILAEDTQFAAHIQVSLESPGSRGLVLNAQERRIYHWHEELDRRLGAGRIPARLRVTPVLAPFVRDTLTGR